MSQNSTSDKRTRARPLVELVLLLIARTYKHVYVSHTDDLPVWGMLGKKKPMDPEDRIHPIHGAENHGVFTNEWSLMFERKTTYDLYTHQQYVFEYNKNRITAVTLNTLDPYPVGINHTDAGHFDMFYSVKWVENAQANYETRYEKYLDKEFFEHKIHWFAIFNSFMMVVFLTGLVAMILMRTVRKDYQRYNADEEDLELMERDVNEETGWKLVHGDVFRPVEWLIPLSIFIGTGAQLTALASLMIVFGIAGELWASRGAMVTCMIFSWAFTSFVNGYVSGGFYARNDGKDWIKNMLLTAMVFPAFVFVIAFFVNLLAMYYGSMSQVPIGTTLIILIIWGLISFPLTLAGTVIGRNWAGTADLPCRVKRIPSPIPEIPIYFHPIVVSIFSGLLPFGSIFIELYFVMTSFWSYKVYYVYGFMLLSFIILMMVTACICIVGTYFLLNSENYHWQWTSFNSGASIMVYIYCYCIYYFEHKTNMMGFFQTVYYFGYSLMLAVGVGLACGFVGYMASSVFVKRIYRNVKCD